MNTQLPQWVENLKSYYLSGESIQFVLHGNVRDVFLHEGELLSLESFLYKAILQPTREHVVFYEASQGFSFPDNTKKQQFFKTLNAHLAILGEPPILEDLPKRPIQALPILEQLLHIPHQKTAVLISYLETIVPAADMSFLNSEERHSLVTLQRWSANQRLLASDNMIVMICENLADIHQRIAKNPQVISLSIPLPQESERHTLVSFAMQKYPEVTPHMKPEHLARMTAGLRTLQLEALFRQARHRQQGLTFELVRQRKKMIIEQECFGLVELVEPKYDLSVVGGIDKIKSTLKKVAGYIREGPLRRVPMGIFFVGPMGTGKTFVAEAFAGESQLTCLKLKNFRDKWVGSTEANLEKIFHIVKSLGPVMMIIDEVDRAMGSATNEGDSGVSSRVYASIKAFMSDTSHRGHILWLLMSNRPDKLDIDLTRAGRIDLKLPFFFPDTDQERCDVLKALIKKNQINVQFEDEIAMSRLLNGYSGAEIEAVLLMADELTAEAGRKRLRDRDLQSAIEDYIPNRNDMMIEFMELLAVFQCSSRRLLPERYQNQSSEAIYQRLIELESSMT